MQTLLKYVNQHSFVLSAIGIFALVGYWLLRDGIKPIDLIALAALLAGLLIAFFLTRPGPSTLSDAGSVSAQIGAGRHVLLEFQSNY